jgi:hypothetical protein
MKSFKLFINESLEQDDIDKYWNRQLGQIKDEREKEREIKRVTTDIINAREIANKFLTFISTKSEDEFEKWVNENPYDAIEMQNDLEEHSYTKSLWWYGFDRTQIPFNQKTIEDYLYEFLTTDVDKIKNKYKNNQ